MGSLFLIGLHTIQILKKIMHEIYFLKHKLPVNVDSIFQQTAYENKLFRIFYAFKSKIMR